MAEAQNGPDGRTLDFRGSHLHPSYIVRVAGEPASLLDRIEDGSTARLLGRLEELRDSLRSEAPAIGKLLEPLIPQLDKLAGREVLNAKRALFNLRPVDDTKLAGLSAHLDSASFERIRGFAARIRELGALESEIAASYEAEMAAGGLALPAMVDRPNLAAALSYTSPVLYKELKERLPLGRERSASGKLRRNLEDSLLQYLTRIVAKTSPLSTFTVLHVGRWDEGGAGTTALDFGEGRLDRRVEAKGALLKHLAAALLGDFERVAPVFPLEINPSAAVVGDRLRLRAINSGNLASGRFWGTGEAIAEVNNSGVIGLIVHIFETSGGGSIKAADLVERICALAPKLAAPAVWAFLRKLYDVQYLRADTGLVEQEDTLAWFESLLAKGGDERTLEARALTEELRRELETFAGGDPATRADIALRLQEVMRRLAELIGAEDHPTLFRPTFFENCYLEGSPKALDPAAVEDHADDLDLVLELSRLTEYSQRSRSVLADFFIMEYGAEGVCEDVVGFLERYDAIYGPGVVGHPFDPAKEAPASAETRGLDSARAAFKDYLEPLLRGGEDVSIDPEELRRLLAMVPAPIARRSLSQSYLVQFAQEDERRLCIVNQSFGGRSSLMSRFLEVLDEDELDGIRAYLRRGSDTGEPVELPGVFGFNGNHHPPLADRELGIPPFPRGRRSSTVVPIGALRLVYDPSLHLLKFETPEGERFDLFYLGFLIPSLLPSLQRILALSFMEGPNQFAFETLVERNLVGAQHLCVVPRLSLGSVVLGRRMWIFPSSEQPDPDLNAFDFYMAVQKWRAAHGLPAEVFVRSIPIPDGSNAEDAVANLDWHRLDAKNLKPFYVKLDSPRLARLLQRMLKRSRFALSVTELLPRLDDQHVLVDGERHVAELQIELTRPAGPMPEGAKAEEESDFDIRIAYFDEDRTALLLGPVKDAAALLRDRFGIGEAAVQMHWKFGPHVDITIRASRSRLDGEILPAVREIVDPWLSWNPSRTVLEPAAYDALSRKIGMSELEPGPYLPLLENNKVTVEPHRPNRALLIPELAASKSDFLSVNFELVTALLERKPEDDDAFLLTLIAMMAVAGETYRPHGLSRGFMSFRSHAEYFFAAYDKAGALRSRFDVLEKRFAPRVDEILRAVTDGNLDALPLPAPHRRLVARWRDNVALTASRNEAVVAENHQQLVESQVFDGLVETVTQTAPKDFQAEFREKEVSELGKAFEQDEGERIRRSPEFIAYRTTVNFFYLLLPLLHVSPIQKFCLCHILASSAERTFNISWRTIMGIDADSSVDA